MVLVTGTGSTDNALFTIQNNQLRTNAVFDYETKNNYSIRVKTTDQGGLSYEKPLTIGVTDVNEFLADLVPDKLSNWDDKIVISTQPGTNTNATQITPTDTLYIDWAATNKGTKGTVNKFYIRLSLDGVSVPTNWVSDPSLTPTNSVFVQDYPISPLTAGTHTLKLEVDYTNQETESNETNNIYERTFTVTGVSPQPSLTISNSNPVTIVEGSAATTNLTFTVSLSAASSQTVSVNYTTVNGKATAGNDYTATSGTLTFAPNQVSQTITVPILNDNLNEADEAFTVKLSNPVNATISTTVGTGKITDTLTASVTTTLAAEIENLTLTGTSAINGTGNTNNNKITGNSGNNTLDGGTGNDTLVGGAGNDILIGGAGNDSLTGGTGGDRFKFNSRTEGLDKITDFVVIDDTIEVSAAGFGGGLTKGAALKATQFVIGTAATTTSHRIIYNSTNGALLFDQDGSTAAIAPIQIATLSTGLAMTNNDIFVVA